ncbi:hypothetical protein DER29_0465 [Micromonospora sp. M71_S20]|uniref:hypothetical protein n=1 Tax=Micromonospora sp. M71_S20 TaxID=592872 RepID=UPI000EACCAD4|nr:hypothetical protein [Micromonospora sp. M71_S20]RLK22628.1 hypothetical protein DER29_0465 [Micromonospora sp. M71_S20]
MATDPAADLAELVAEAAERHALDPADFEARVRRQLARRMARGAQPVKMCRTCVTLRPALDFAEDARSRDGLRSTCRACAAEAERDRRVS